MAAVAIGICFGATGVTAESPYTCAEIATLAHKNLKHRAGAQDMYRTTYVAGKELYKIAQSEGADVTKLEKRAKATSHQLELLGKQMTEYVNEAANWATIYTAFCK